MGREPEMHREAAGGGRVVDSPLITRPYSRVGHQEQIWRVEGPQAQVGSRVLHALGPKAEGAELKIAGWLWWPPAPACPALPRGQLRPLQAPPGTFWEHFLLLLLTLAIPRQRLQGGQRGGRAVGGLGVRALPRPGQPGSTAGQEPPSSHPGLFSPTGSKPRTSGWGSKCRPQAQGPCHPCSPPNRGGGLHSSPARPGPLPLPPTPHTASSVALTSVFSPPTHLPSRDSEEVSTFLGGHETQRGWDPLLGLGQRSELKGSCPVLPP